MIKKGHVNRDAVLRAITLLERLQQLSQTLHTLVHGEPPSKRIRTHVNQDQVLEDMAYLVKKVNPFSISLNQTRSVCKGMDDTVLDKDKTLLDFMPKCREKVIDYTNGLLNGDPNLRWPSGLFSCGEEDEVHDVNYDSEVDEIEMDNITDYRALGGTA